MMQQQQQRGRRWRTEVALKQLKSCNKGRTTEEEEEEGSNEEDSAHLCKQLRLHARNSNRRRRQRRQ